MRRSKFYAIFGVLMIAALMLTACPAQGVPAGAPAPADTGSESAEAVEDASMADMDATTVNINWGTEPPTADPALSTDTTSSDVIQSIFVMITATDPDTQEAIPYLAESWEANEDSTVWTFNLRNDIPWVTYNQVTGEVEQVMDENGEPRMVDAHDVVYGAMRSLNPETGSQYSYILYPIAGAEAFNSADPDAEDFSTVMESVGIEALDDHTVQFTLEFGAGYWPQIASMPTLAPQPQWIIEDKGDRWIEPGFIVTNGPYAMEEWVHGDHLNLVKNPHFPLWGTDFADGNVERIHGLTIEEASTAFALYEDGELDTTGVPQDQIDRAKAEMADEYFNAPSNCTYYFGFVTQQEPTNDVNVRRALSMALDRQTLVDQVTRGGQIPANTFTNPLNFGHAAESPDVAPWALTEEKGGTGYAAAVEMGKELLAEAGYPEGAGLDILLMHNVSEGHARIAQAAQAMWQAAYPDMNVTIETQEWLVYLQTIDKDSPLEDQPNVFRLGWCADYPHANNWLYEVFNTEAGANRVRLSTDDPQVGDLVAEYNELTRQAQTASEEEAVELYRQAEQLLIDDIAAILPIYYYTTVAVTKPHLERLYEPGNSRFYKWQLNR